MVDQRARRSEIAYPPPRFLDSWYVWLGLVLLVLVPFFLPIAQTLRRDPVVGSLGDHLHIPLLAGITLLLYWKGPLRGNLVRVSLFAAAIGGIIEVLQLLVGRSAEFNDWLLDLVGIGLVVGWIGWRGHGNRLGMWLVVLLLLIFPVQFWQVPLKIQAKYEARELFPQLADFDNPGNMRLWIRNHNSRLEQVHADSMRGNVLRIQGAPPNRWPGGRYLGFPSDWGNYTTLCWDARLIEGAEGCQDYRVLVGDFSSRHEGTYLGEDFCVSQEWQSFSMPFDHRDLCHTDRLLDLDDVDMVMFYVRNPEIPFTIEIDNIHLR